MPKIFCVSDIHAHLDALEEALGRVKEKASEGDRLIFLGDYIDNGPDSGGVLRRIFELQKAYGPERVIVLRGNHEEMLLEWLDTFAGPAACRRDEYGWPLWSDWLDGDEDPAKPDSGVPVCLLPVGHARSIQGEPEHHRRQNGAGE